MSGMKIQAEILKVVHGIGKASQKAFHQIEVGLPGWNKGSFFVKEEMTLGLFEGCKVELHFDLEFKNWKPQLNVNAVTIL